MQALWNGVAGVGLFYLVILSFIIGGIGFFALGSVAFSMLPSYVSKRFFDISPLPSSSPLLVFLAGALTTIGPSLFQGYIVSIASSLVGNLLNSSNIK